MTETVHIWMAFDPETFRVTVQDREFADGDFPLGLRGVGWPQRELDVGQDELDGITSGELTGPEVNALHRGWWTAAGPTAWPDGGDPA